MIGNIHWRRRRRRRLLPPVWFTGSWWWGRSTSLEFIQVLHQNIGPVVVENLLDLFHVVALFVLDHLKTLVRDQLGLHQKLLVFIPCGLNSITNPAVELFLAFLV